MDQKISRCLSVKHRMLYKAHSSRLADSAEFGSFIIFDLSCNSREGELQKTSSNANICRHAKYTIWMLNCLLSLHRRSQCCTY